MPVATDSGGVIRPRTGAHTTLAVEQEVAEETEARCIPFVIFISWKLMSGCLRHRDLTGA